MVDGSLLPMATTGVLHEAIVAFSLLLTLLRGADGISCPHGVACEDYTSRAAAESITRHQAILNLTYHDPSSTLLHTDSITDGQFGITSRVSEEYGVVINVKIVSIRDNTKCGVGPLDAITTLERWIALIDKGSCRGESLQAVFSGVRGAAAVILYSDEGELDPVGRLLHEVNTNRKTYKIDDTVYIYIPRTYGVKLARLVDNGTRVYMNISVGRSQMIALNGGINRTSMLFLSISFIVLMIISMAWLVFYYVQRSRHTYAKQRISRRMITAAKKAITRMPLKTVRGGEEHMEPGFDLCAICIEGYRSSEVARILPCKHVFHKHCIDPWLLEQRNCPICKIDILKAFGLQVYRSRESALNVENELGSASYAYSDFGALDSGRDFDSDGVEIVRFQLAHIECHTPATATTPAPRSTPLPRSGARCGSLSEDCESQTDSATCGPDNETGVESGYYAKSCDKIGSMAALSGSNSEACSLASISSNRGCRDSACKNPRKCCRDSSVDSLDAVKARGRKLGRGGKSGACVSHQASVHRVPSYQGAVQSTSPGGSQRSAGGGDSDSHGEFQPLMVGEAAGERTCVGSSTSIN